MVKHLSVELNRLSVESNHINVELNRLSIEKWGRCTRVCRWIKPLLVKLNLPRRVN